MDTPAASPRLRVIERAYVEHGALVRATLRARGVPSSAIDDVLHDVFLTAYARVDRRDASVRLAHWLIGLARNAAFSHRRGAARRRRRHAATQIDRICPPMSDEELDARRSWEVLTQFLADLPARQREAFMLCEVAQFPASELAAVWGCTINTVHSRLRLARARFAERFPVARGVADAEALLTAARHELSPEPERQRRAWAVLAVELARPWWMSATAAKAALLATVGAAVSVTVVAFASPPTDPPVHDVATVAQAIGTPTVDATASSIAAPPRVATAPAIAAPAPVAAPASIKPRAPAPKPAPPPSDAGLPAQPDVKAETALLSAARAHLRTGASTEALQLLADHERTFPAGILTIERHRLRIDALCDLDRIDEARAAVRALDRIAPARVGRRTEDAPCEQ